MTKFDELNRLKRFFSVMDVDNKEERVSFAQLLNEALIYIFVLIDTEYRLDKNKEPKDYYSSLEQRIKDCYEEAGLYYENKYIPKISKEIVDTTFRHLDDTYYFSDERALLIAQNEANTAYNHRDYIEAVKTGKNYKRWITEHDERVRPTHASVDSVRIPIEEMFHVGNDDMRYPHDWNASPENIINCRCVCIYE